ncbi:MAG: MAPEG family protein [Myxococcota bacterium]
MPIPITALYAGIMGLILFALDFHVGGMRGRKKISVYDAGDREMAIAVRRQGNFVEHVPLALILIGVLELSGASALGLHLLGGGLTIARIAHPFGLDYEVANKPARIVGAGLTAVVTVVASIWAIWTFVS